MAKMVQIQRDCPTCGTARLYTKSGVNHLVHGLVSLFLCGLWIPIWLLAAASNAFTPFRCTTCGHGYNAGVMPGVALLVLLGILGLMVGGAASSIGGRPHQPAVAPVAVPAARPVGIRAVPSPEPVLGASQEVVEDGRELQAQLVRELAEREAKRKAGLRVSTFKYYEGRADKGDVDAQYRLGQMYLAGDGTETNYAKAREYLLKAAMGGSQDAYKLMQTLPRKD